MRMCSAKVNSKSGFCKRRATLFSRLCRQHGVTHPRKHRRKDMRWREANARAHGLNAYDDITENEKEFFAWKDTNTRD